MWQHVFTYMNNWATRFTLKWTKCFQGIIKIKSPIAIILPYIFIFTNQISFSMKIEKNKKLDMDQNVQKTFHLPLLLYHPSIKTAFIQCNGIY